MSIPPSPSTLIPTTPPRAPGVRRLNRVPYFIIALGLLAVIVAVGYSFVSKMQNSVASTAAVEDDKRPKGGKTPNFLSWPEGHGGIRAALTREPEHGEIPPPAGSPPATTNNQPPAAQQQQVAGPPDLQEQARVRAWSNYYRQREQLQQARFDADLAARRGENQGSDQQQPQQPQQQPPQTRQGPATADPSLLEPAAARGFSVGGTDPAGQTGKQAFLRTPGDVFGLDEDLPGSVHGPKHSTIMEGEFIPLRLVEGATSDSPGQLIAEVTTTVYDTETGQIPLIPQWTRFIGEYDVAVSAGQDRIGIIFHRMRFPDTSSRQIGTVQGADLAGLAGAADLLHTHFWDKFGSAIVVAIVGAGVQLAQPPPSSFSTYSPGSTATGQFTQQLGQFGTEAARQGLSRPNTIELRPGLQIMAKVNHDWKLPEYVDHRG